MDLNLSGPSRPCPLIVDEDQESPPIVVPDLTVSSAPSPADVLPPATALSGDQEDFRRQIRDEVRLTFEGGAASGTVRTYEAILRGIAPKATLRLGSSVLPMATEAQFLSFFGAVSILGPKSPSPVSGLPSVRWSYVKLVKAAIAHWRAVRAERAVFDADWSPRMVVFWAGVKRKCIHASSEKSPLIFADALELRRKAEVGCVRLRSSVGVADLAPGDLAWDHSWATPCPLGVPRPSAWPSSALEERRRSRASA